METLRDNEIRGVAIGLGSDDEELPSDGEALGILEVATGDETLLQVPYAVHYTVADAYRYHFGIADSVELVTALSATALQRAAAKRTTSEILVDQRDFLEQEVTRNLTEELGSIQAGLEVTGVRIGSIHAPGEVHTAFRDVASALEDKERWAHEAEADRISTLTEARGTAASLVEAARGGATSATKESQGRAEAFQAFIEAYRDDPRSTILRLQLDMLPRSLGGARIVFDLGEDIDIVNLPPSNSEDAFGDY